MDSDARPHRPSVDIVADEWSRFELWLPRMFREFPEVQRSCEVRCTFCHPHPPTV